MQRPIAMSEAARRQGIQPEMPKTLLDQCPSLLLRSRSLTLEMTAHQALLEAAKSFSPRLEEISSDTLIMDLAGMDKLFERPEALARKLAQQIKALGLVARIAIASNSDAARAAARGKPEITVISPGREAEVLGALSLSVLDPPPEILATLERWGIRDFQGLAALPTAELSERLGQEGVRLQALARGNFLRPLIGRELPPEFNEQMELEYPIEELEPLAFILNRLLGSLCERLNAYSVAAQQIDLYLDLEPHECSTGVRPAVAGASRSRTVRGQDAHATAGGTPALQRSQYEKIISLPVPTRDPKLLLNLLRMQLEADPPAAPIIKVALKAAPASPRVAQGGLFAPPVPDPEKFEITLARIAGLVGQQNVGSPRLLDSHRPESFEMRPFAFLPAIGSAGVSPAVPGASRPSQCAGRMPASQRAGRPRYVAKAAPVFRAGQPGSERVALRVYRPPAPASVGLKNGIPDQLSFRGVRGRVVAAGGPWRTSGCWWRPDAWQFDEWDIELKMAGGGLAGFYRIYLDRALEKWFVRGEYD